MRKEKESIMSKEAKRFCCVVCAIMAIVCGILAISGFYMYGKTLDGYYCVDIILGTIMCAFFGALMDTIKKFG